MAHLSYCKPIGKKIPFHLKISHFSKKVITIYIYIFKDLGLTIKLIVLLKNKSFAITDYID